jgi:choice-of-anchor B domain-containing protein
MKKIITVIFFFFITKNFSFSQYNVEKLSNLKYVGNTWLSSIWGYSDTIKHKEYAIVGVKKGTSIVDITNPRVPVQVAFVNGSPGTNVTWREMKTYSHYAYIVHDVNNGLNEGIQIIDLQYLPDSVKSYNVKTMIQASTTITFNAQHTCFIDEQGYLYINGGNSPTQINGIGYNGTTIFDLKPNPLKPTYVGKANLRYVHDCFVRDSLLFQAHSNTQPTNFSIWNVKDKSNPVLLQDFQTPYSTTHNTWLSDDSKTLFVTHEQFNLPMEAYDISDLSNIHQIAEFKIAPANKEIAHNVHVINDYIVVPYYSDGLAIFDASVPDNVVTIGYYDTHPAQTQTEDGVWGAYPYYNSGNIVLSDMDSGLYVIKPTYVRAARIVGTVTDTNTTQPILNATISFADTAITSTSNLSGFYKMGTPRQGTFRFKAEKTGYITKYFNYTLQNGRIDTVNIQLRQNPVYSNQTVRNCNATSYTLPDGRVVTNAGIYISDIVLPSGRDSIITTNLIMQSSSSVITTFCQSTAYILPGGRIVTAGGTYQDTLRNFVGCDSVITTILSQISPSASTNPVSICDGENFVLPNGTSVTTGGVYTNKLTNAVGCDSVITTYLFVNPTYNITKQDSVYKPNTYTLPSGTVVSISGTYVSNLQSASGCDSVITVQLKVLDTLTITGIKNNTNTIEIKYVINNGELTIINKTNAKISTLRIYNSIGAVILTVDKPQNSLFLPNLPKDIYLIEAVTNNNERNIGKIAIY